MALSNSPTSASTNLGPRPLASDGPGWVLWAIPVTLLLLAALFAWYQWGAASHQPPPPSASPSDLDREPAGADG